MTSSVHASPRTSSAPAIGQGDRRATRALYHVTCISQAISLQCRVVACIMQVTTLEEEPAMLPAVHALISELDAEAPTTRRVLERLPADQFAWQPHPRSFTAGQLAQHIAVIPAHIVRMAQSDAVDMAA